MSVHIIQCGTQSPLGTWTSMSAANVRAGLARITVYPDYEDSEWAPVKVAMADYLDADILNTPRFLELGMEALNETLAPLKKIESRPETIPLLLGLPGKRDGLDKDLESKIIERLSNVEKEFQIGFQPEFLPFDHAAGLIAVKEAVNRLENNEAEFCVAGGIESYISPDTMAWLEEKDQLKCTDNKWGMIPGEAAGFCLLTTLETAQKYELPIAAEILAVSSAEEQAKDNEVCLGKALIQSLENVFKLLPEGEKINQVFCDMNGQRYRVDEYGYAVLRLGRYFDDPKDFFAPANQWGDIGAASAPLFFGLATESGRKGYAKGPNNLVFAMSPNGTRAAAIIKLNQMFFPA